MFGVAEGPIWLLDVIINPIFRLNLAIVPKTGALNSTVMNN
jgi:hypothetical protein